MTEIKFAVFTDLHYDHIPDGYDRIKNFVSKVKGKEVDFIVNLGDFCKPIYDNIKVLELLRSVDKPCYHVIGNHDSDSYPKKQALKFLGLEKSYYSFIYGQVKFIVLDTCFIEQNGHFSSYNKKNYAHTKGNYPVLPKEQLNWLRMELNDDYSNYVILSHHSLENDFMKRGVHNRLEIQTLINKANDSGKRVALCINGHDHADSLKSIGDTYYFGLNGMSYIWFGERCNKRPYSDELYQRYPGLKDIVLYRDGLHAIVTISESGKFKIEGMKTSYKTITPEDLEIEGPWNGRAISSCVTSVELG
ncbi:metallophosphoesterase [Wukongibacter baidiensis]|uniref:metallophosphoesterase family protein n=1 Tax=Wukongibacter baidiensis TaxID=1723361 RepID=UPI003D7F992E